MKKSEICLAREINVIHDALMNQKINWLCDIKNAWCIYYGVDERPLASVAVKFLEDAYVAIGGTDDAIACFAGVFEIPTDQSFQLSENKWARFV